MIYKMGILIYSYYHFTPECLQIVHKQWEQVLTERRNKPKLMKSEVSNFNTFTDIRERAKTTK